MRVEEVEDRAALVRLDPVIARDERVVLIRLAVALLPIEELPACDADPRDEALGGDVCLGRPSANEVDDLVARVMGDPAAGQGSPSSFFN